MDTRSEKIGYKIREAQTSEDSLYAGCWCQRRGRGQVSVRSRFLGDEGAKDLGEFITSIKAEIKSRENRKVEVQEEQK